MLSADKLFLNPSLTHALEGYDNHKWLKSKNIDRSNPINGRIINLMDRFDEKVQRIGDKARHTFVPSSVIKGDMQYLKENGLNPDEAGNIKVSRKNGVRIYRQHDDARLYPVSGDHTESLPGPEASYVIDKFFSQDDERSMSNFISSYSLDAHDPFYSQSSLDDQDNSAPSPRALLEHVKTEHGSELRCE